jgi:hypothetical protein
MEGAVGWQGPDQWRGLNAHGTAHDLSVVSVQVSKHRKNVTGTRLYEVEPAEPVACRLWVYWEVVTCGWMWRMPGGGSVGS